MRYAFLFPLLISAMIACIVLPVTEIMRYFVPQWQTTPYIVLSVVAALEGCYAQYLVERRGLRSWQLVRFRVIELATLFILLKLTLLALNPPRSLSLLLNEWRVNPFMLLEWQTLAGVVIVFIAWSAATETTEDIGNLKHFIFPNDFGNGQVSPLARLNDRMFQGGMFILIATALSRTPSEIFNFNRPPLAGLILNVLIYFVLGLILLGQARYIALNHDWEIRKIAVLPEVGKRWWLYSFIFITLAGLAVVLLPTRYTQSLFDIIDFILGIGLFIIFIISQIIAALLAIPLSILIMFFPRLPFLPVPPIVPPLLPTLPKMDIPANNFFELLKSVVFWGVLILVVGYIIVSYVRDRPELLALLRQLKFVQLWQTGWVKLRDWWRTWWGQVGSRWVQTLRQQWLGDAAEKIAAAFNVFRGRPRSPREQILFFYLSILHRAQQQGFARRQPETPFEYEPTLEAHAPEAQTEAAALTQTFVQARYSLQEVSEADVQHAKEEWERIRQNLKKQPPK